MPRHRLGFACPGRATLPEPRARPPRDYHAAMLSSMHPLEYNTFCTQKYFVQNVQKPLARKSASPDNYYIAADKTI
jgi:hypothetical protein